MTLKGEVQSTEENDGERSWEQPRPHRASARHRFRRFSEEDWQILTFGFRVKFFLEGTMEITILSAVLGINLADWYVCYYISKGCPQFTGMMSNSKVASQ